MKTISRTMFSLLKIVSLETSYKALLCLLLIVFLSGCGGRTTGTSHIQQGKETELKRVSAVVVAKFQSSNELVSQAVQNIIIEMLLPSGIRIVNDKASADAVIRGTITFSHDAVSSGGGYVSGITAHIIKANEIIAAASETQMRTEYWIPDPPEVMARKVGKKIRKMLGR